MENAFLDINYIKQQPEKTSIPVQQPIQNIIVQQQINNEQISKIDEKINLRLTDVLTKLKINDDNIDNYFKYTKYVLIGILLIFIVKK